MARQVRRRLRLWRDKSAVAAAMARQVRRRCTSVGATRRRDESKSDYESYERIRWTNHEKVCGGLPTRGYAGASCRAFVLAFNALESKRPGNISVPGPPNNPNLALDTFIG